MANTCHMQEKKPQLGAAQETGVGWCSAGPCNLAVQCKTWNAEPKKFHQNCICSVHVNKSRTVTFYFLNLLGSSPAVFKLAGLFWPGSLSQLLLILQ